MGRTTLIIFITVTITAGVFVIWLKSQMAYVPWTLTSFEHEGRELYRPDLNLGKDHIYTDAENEAIFTKVSPVQHILDPRRGLSALNGVLAFRDKVVVGQMAPDFDLTTTDGRPVELSELREKIVVLMFVAMSCPPAREQVPRFTKLRDKYKAHNVEFLLVYSRERHAGERGYPDIQFADSGAQKFKNADMLAELTDLTIAVDGIDERVLSSYGRVPNASYIIDKKGVVVYRSTWADSAKVELVLDHMLDIQ